MIKVAQDEFNAKWNYNAPNLNSLNASSINYQVGLPMLSAEFPPILDSKIPDFLQTFCRPNDQFSRLFFTYVGRQIWYISVKFTDM